MKAKAAFYFLILCRQLLTLKRFCGKKGVEVKVAELGRFTVLNINPASNAVHVVFKQ
jgi:hypothetical protein